MIGGIDIEIPTTSGATSIEVSVRAITRHWPHAEFENGVTGDRYDELCHIPLGKIEEMFVYRDGPSADSWDKEGAIPELYNTMIHIIVDKDMITLVVDETDALIEEIVAEIWSALSNDDPNATHVGQAF